MVILYPTETVYGLGVDALDPEALAQLSALKGRQADKASSWLVRSMEDIERYAVVDALAAKIAERFLPGPVTLVLPARPEISGEILPADRTIGFRISLDPLAQALAEELGVPITCTSANVSGSEPQAAVSGILAQFGERAAMIDRVIDGGPRSGPPSTVVRVRNGAIDILREGAILRTALDVVL